MADQFESFARKMKAIYPLCGYIDVLEADRNAIKTMCDELRRLGYSDGIDVFECNNNLMD